MKNNLQNNIKNVMIVFLLLFLGLISYLSYNSLFKSEEAINSAYNKRQQAEKSKILRGTIYDRDMNILASSTKTGEFSQSRSYTGGEAFAQVVGYYDAVYGASGIEKKFDKELAGTMVSNTIRNTVNNLIAKYKGQEVKDELKGNNVITTLDSSLQKAAYNVLGERNGAVVVLEPSTGKVLAMVSKPSFDPNTIRDDFEKLSQNTDTPFLNRAVSGMYPPGSSMKIITAVSAIENIPEITTRIFNDNGRINFNDKESLENYNGYAYGNIDLRTAFVKSSNVVFGTLAMELGNEKLRETAEKFFFNRDIPSRTLTIDNSIFPSYKADEKGNIAQSGIGQSGVLATPMIMALAAGTIANDGVMMEPNIVSGIADTRGNIIKEYKPVEAATVTTPEIAGIVKEYMKGVVEEGTGINARSWSAQVYGKTGTADTDAGDKIPHTWFVGFAENSNDEIAFAIIAEKGGNDTYNGAAMAKQLVGAYFGSN